MRKIRFLFVAIVTLLALAAPASAWQQPPASAPSPAESTPLDLTAADIQARITQISADANLPEDLRQRVTDRLNQALSELTAANNSQTNIEQYRAQQRRAPAALEDLRRSLAAPHAEFTPPDADLAELERLLSEAQLELEQARKRLEDADAETRRRSDRLTQLPQRIDERLAELEAARGQLTTPPPPREPPLASEANTTFNRTRVHALSLKVDELRQELQMLEATREAQPLLRDQAALEVKALEEKVAKLNDAVNESRRRDAERAAREAASLVAQQAYLPLRQIAEVNAQLAAERAAEDGVANEIARVSNQIETRRARRFDIRDEVDAVKKRIDTVGLTSFTAAELRQIRAELPDPRQLRSRIRERQAKIAAARSRWLSLDDQRAELADVPAEVDHRAAALAAVAPLTGLPQDIDLRAELTYLLETQRNYLDQLIADYDNYIRRLIALSSEEQLLIDETEDFAAFVDERVLWAASTTQLNLQSLADARGALTALVDRETWADIVNTYVEASWTTNLWPVILLVAIVPLLMIARRLRRLIRKYGEQAARPSANRFRPTVITLIATLTLAGIWPAFIWLMAYLAALPFSANSFADAVSAAFRTAALVLFPLEIARQACRRGGLVDAHLGGHGPTLDRVRFCLRLYIFALLPGVVLAALMANQSVDAYDDSLGRFAYILAMLFTSAFVFAAFRHRRFVSTDHDSAPSTPASKKQLASPPSVDWWARLRTAVFFLCVTGPFALAAAAALGYYYTAIRLTSRGAATVCVIVAAIALYQLARRWLLVVRRRVAIQQARQRIAQIQVAAANPSAPAVVDSIANASEGDQLDLAQINDQTVRLVRGLLTALAVAACYVVWVDVFPAFGILRQVEIYSTTIETVRSTTLEDGTVVNQSVSEYYPITLIELGLAVLILLVTYVASRNAPGFIEIVALQRLPLDRGTRYAISSVVSYLITVLGIIAAANVLGIGWSKVQWLAAAAALGLGFGLQEIFANLVSGVMIFVERPIRVGDVVTTGDVTGVVSQIRIRATTITNWDRKELIIPNKEFITGRVINWTLTDNVNRVVINVGVAYGSDTERVRDIILAAASDHPLVLADPPPTVFFEQFGDSSLNFTLRAYLAVIDDRLPVIHDLHTTVDRAFREAGIEIPFPQRDLHIRSGAEPPLQSSHQQNESQSTPVTPPTSSSKTVPRSETDL